MQSFFRGKTKQGQLVQGFYAQSSDKKTHYIISSFDCANDSKSIHINAHVVNPESVKAWTGLTDCNGVKIFEADWVRDSRGEVGVIVESDETCEFRLLVRGKGFPLCKNNMQYYEVLRYEDITFSE